MSRSSMGEMKMWLLPSLLQSGFQHCPITRFLVLTPPLDGQPTDTWVSKSSKMNSEHRALDASDSHFSRFKRSS